MDCCVKFSVILIVIINIFVHKNYTNIFQAAVYEDACFLILSFMECFLKLSVFVNMIRQHLKVSLIIIFLLQVRFDIYLYIEKLLLFPFHKLCPFFIFVIQLYQLIYSSKSTPSVIALQIFFFLSCLLSLFMVFLDIQIFFFCSEKFQFF